MGRRRRPVPLPPRNGVDATRVVARVDDQRVIDVLLTSSSLADLTEPALRQRFRDGEVVDGAGRVLAPDDVVPAHTPMFLYRDLPVETEIDHDMPILHLDDDIVVVDKPHFLATMPRGAHVVQTALVRLRRELGNDLISPAHRLDRLTAGVLLLTCRPEVRRAYQQLFAERLVHKQYRAAAPCPSADVVFPAEVRNRILKDAGDLRARVVDGPVNAISRIEVDDSVTRTDGLTEYRLTPVTGRTHQLRVHMAALGMPIDGDPLYPQVRPELAARPDAGDFSRPLRLVAARLEFDDPYSGTRRTFVSLRDP
ncbi:pseudouridine synthase [Williamsia sp. CHRR-6]|uniref:pseudouridine synthase n=1 Tax=Williamsia sp. CHRR-6 TaxID=2835871 RepID=UPI001BDB1AC6|nr:pseudouridine synthase [Williamsia sp. CHRR-6]MBT0567221.1 pseudouridine synthase [Williamsia sp. CHRR-6]